MPGPPASRLRRALFALVPLVLVLGLVEGLARLLPPAQLQAHEALMQSRAGPEGLVPNLDVPGWDLAADGGTVVGVPYTVNQWRMRGPAVAAEKAAGSLRITVTGDSTMFGSGLPWADTFLARLGRAAAMATGRTVEVGACACPGHSSHQSVLKYQRQCRGFGADVVIIGNHHSDLTQRSAADHEAFPPTRWPGFWRGLDRSAAYRALHTLVASRRADAPPPPEVIPQIGGVDTGAVPRVPEDRYRANLTQLVAMVRADGAQPVLLVLPVNADVNPKISLPALGQRYREIMREVAQAEGVDLIDGERHFARQHMGQALFYDPVHLNRDGAGALARQLLSELQLPAG